MLLLLVCGAWCAAGVGVAGAGAARSRVPSGSAPPTAPWRGRQESWWLLTSSPAHGGCLGVGDAGGVRRLVCYHSALQLGRRGAGSSLQPCERELLTQGAFPGCLVCPAGCSKESVAVDTLQPTWAAASLAVPALLLSLLTPVFTRCSPRFAPPLTPQAVADRGVAGRGC